MNYSLYPSSLNDLSSIRTTIFKNRGYVPPNINFHISPPCALQNMHEAVKLFGDKFAGCVDIIVDCDFDGYASASILYRYIKEHFRAEIKFHMHNGKQHGLSDDVDWENIRDTLLIIPDAGSNDAEQCMKLYQQGVDIIILDHHLQKVENPYAVVVNSQNGDYGNRYLCGTGVTWQFICALDECLWTDSADDYIDMVALATVADIMDVTIPENRILIDAGLAKINHPLLVELADKSDKQISSLLGVDAQFSIIPLVNAVVRVGSIDDKDILFRAFCCENEYFDYKKRSGEVIQESIYERAARLCVNAKARQRRISDSGLEKLVEQIERRNLDQNKILVVNGTGLEPTITGVMASKLADMYQKPCLVLHKDIANVENEPYYHGSARNARSSTVPELFSVLADTDLFEFMGGHSNAFGVGILKSNIALMIQKVNEMLPDEAEPCIYADFIVAPDEINFDTAVILQRQVRKYCGTGFPEPVFVVENLVVHRDQVHVMGKNQSSWKIVADNDIAFVKFGVGEDDPLLAWYNDGSSDEFEITLAGTLSLNQYRGLVSAQMIITDYEVVGE